MDRESELIYEAYSSASDAAEGIAKNRIPLSKPGYSNPDKYTDALSDYLLGEKVPVQFVDRRTGEVIINSNEKIRRDHLKQVSRALFAANLAINGEEPMATKVRGMIVRWTSPGKVKNDPDGYKKHIELLRATDGFDPDTIDTERILPKDDWGY